MANDNMMLSVAQRYTKLTHKGKGEYAGSCPFCGGDDRFIVWADTNPGWLCRGCSPDHRGSGIDLVMRMENMTYREACDHLGIVLNGSGKPRHDAEDEICIKKGEEYQWFGIVAKYPYHNASGEVVYRTVRYTTPDGKKILPDGRRVSFGQQRWDDGKWRSGVRGKVDYVPYALPSINAAKEGGELVYIVEGEKCCDFLALRGITATTNVGGAVMGKKIYSPEYCQYFAGASVVIVADNDAEGQGIRHARMIAERLTGIAASIDVRQSGIWDEASGQGLDDWLSDGGDIDDLPSLNEEKKIPYDVLWGYFQEDEAGDTKLFASLYKGKYAYDADAKKWYRFVNPHWERCKLPPYAAIYNTLAARYLELAAYEQDKGTKGEVIDAIFKRVKVLRSQRRANAIFAMAAEILQIDGNIWDSNAWVLACKNGVIDLRTGALRAGKPEDYIRTVSQVRYNGSNVASPKWDAFMLDVLDGRSDIARYLQVLFGYAMVGVSSEKVLPILWGEKGWNGRTTMLETLGDVLGDYATAISKDTIIASGNRASGAATPQIMALQGKRLVWASETATDSKLNEETVKKLTGNDTITGRRLFEEQTSFTPTHTLFFLVNDAPQANYGDNSLWLRLKYIPFEVSFVPHPSQANEKQAKPNIKDDLASEASGILAWLVRGCLDWQASPNGLAYFEPESVTQATQAQRQENDALGQFIAELCILDDDIYSPFGDLWDAYEDWHGGGRGRLTKTAFGKQLRERGYERIDQTINGKRGIRCYRGISLKSADGLYLATQTVCTPVSDDTKAKNDTSKTDTTDGTDTYHQSPRRFCPHEGTLLEQPSVPSVPSVTEYDITHPNQQYEGTDGLCGDDKPSAPTPTPAQDRTYIAAMLAWLRDEAQYDTPIDTQATRRTATTIAGLIEDCYGAAAVPDKRNIKCLPEENALEFIAALGRVKAAQR